MSFQLTMFFIFLSFLNTFLYIQNKNLVNEISLANDKKLDIIIENIESNDLKLESLEAEITQIKEHLETIKKNQKSDIYSNTYIEFLKNRNKLAEENLKKNPTLKNSYDNFNDLMNRINYSNYEFGVNHNIIKKHDK